MSSKIAKVIYCIAMVALIISATVPNFSTAHADENVSFQVNVEESLSVAITTPTEWASGNVNEFLRNKVSLNVATNSANGFTASMYSANNTTNLANTSSSSIVLPTLASSSTRSAFPANYWGYSLGAYTLNGADQGAYELNGHTYGETDAGVGSSNYYPLVSTSANPIIIMDGATSAKSSGTQEIYFGAKANASKASGTYTGTVVISVVTGAIDTNNNPFTPTNPATPATDTNPSGATYTGSTSTVGGGTNGTTVYTTTSSTSDTETTTTQINNGDTTAQYPLGVTENSFSNNVSTNNNLATALAIVASVAATSGAFFAIAARREGDDEEQ